MCLVVHWELKKAMMMMMAGMKSLELDSASQWMLDQMTDLEVHSDYWCDGTNVSVDDGTLLG